jgi:hypothetical protein
MAKIGLFECDSWCIPTQNWLKNATNDIAILEFPNITRHYVKDTAFNTISWWYPGVDPPLLYQLMLLGAGTSFNLSIDAFKEWKIFYTVNWCFQGVDPFYYVLKLMFSRGGTFFTLSIDAFKGWTPFTMYLSWCFPGMEPTLLCQLMLFRGGTSFTLSIDAFKGWTPFTMYLSWVCHPYDDHV